MARVSIASLIKLNVISGSALPKIHVMSNPLSSKDWRSGTRIIPTLNVRVDDSRDEVDDFLFKLTDFIRVPQTTQNANWSVA